MKDYYYYDNRVVNLDRIGEELVYYSYDDGNQWTEWVNKLEWYDHAVKLTTFIPADPNTYPPFGEWVHTWDSFDTLPKIRKLYHYKKHGGIAWEESRGFVNTRQVMAWAPLPDEKDIDTPYFDILKEIVGEERIEITHDFLDTIELTVEGIGALQLVHPSTDREALDIMAKEFIEDALWTKIRQ